ncbi:MAG: hypothetical protein ACQERN_06435, partial [Thermodesulfobacteriota bacterium]
MLIHRNIPHFIFIVLVAILFGACGDGKDADKLIVSGTFSMDSKTADSDKPVLVAVTDTLDRKALESNARNSIIEIITADKAEAEFRIDLTEKGVQAGDTVYLIAFADNDYGNDVPFPTPEDRIGFFVPPDSLSPGYTLTAGENKGIHIDINRLIYDYDAAIDGTLTGNQTGKVFLFAYTGEITSSDFSDIDYDKVIGFETLEKGTEPADYTIDILPYGQPLPIDDVKVIALLDSDNNDKISSGDEIGFYKSKEASFLSAARIPESGKPPGVKFGFSMEVPEPSGDDITLSGKIERPGHHLEAPVYLAVFEGEQPGKISDDLLGSVKYFKKLPADSDRYTIDLSDTGLAAGDTVTIAAFADTDHRGGVPNLDADDLIGFYLPPEKLSPAYTLQQGSNAGIDIPIDRTVYDYDASIAGTITGSETGQVFVVAYAG